MNEDSIQTPVMAVLDRGIKIYDVIQHEGWTWIDYDMAGISDLEELNALMVALFRHKHELIQLIGQLQDALLTEGYDDFCVAAMMRNGALVIAACLHPANDRDVLTLSENHSAS
jgi:hypothetical protein